MIAEELARRASLDYVKDRAKHKVLDPVRAHPGTVAGVIGAVAAGLGAVFAVRAMMRGRRERVAEAQRHRVRRAAARALVAARAGGEEALTAARAGGARAMEVARESGRNAVEAFVRATVAKRRIDPWLSGGVGALAVLAAVAAAIAQRNAAMRTAGG